MKVLTINSKTVVAFAVVIILLIVSAVVIIFGRKDYNEEIIPEVEIVLPEGVNGWRL